MAHFALYYLSTTYRKKFHSPDDILDYVDDHWDVFQLGEVGGFGKSGADLGRGPRSPGWKYFMRKTPF